MEKPLYQELASLLTAIATCKQSGNAEWLGHHTARAQYLVANYLPSGSGFDGGTELDLDKSTGERLVFQTSFHHMDEGGCYDGWTDHTIVVRPSLAFGFSVLVGGRDRNDIKDYIAETVDAALHTVIDPEKEYAERTAGHVG